MADKTIKIEAGWVYPAGDIPATAVHLAEDGAVTWDGQMIGYVWKGSRTYSPPTHRGSRIVKYHKQVAEWHGHPAHSTARPEHRRDTRQEVIRDLIAHAIGAERP